MLSRLPKQPKDPRLLVGFDTADDAGVFLLRDDLALVQTVDFFTPIVDNPFVYGQIAALNSLNDVWAMGGEAVTALSVAAFPRKGVSFDILQQIFAGGLDILVANGVALLGGHTVDDAEIKFGYAVTGTIDPNRILRNAGARPGDAIVLTKPIGTGIISTAIKFGRAPADSVEASLATMLHSSRTAARLAVTHGAAGATDVTGFGLMGHLFEMAVASRVAIELRASAIPLLPRVVELARKKNITRGDVTNREYVDGRVRVQPGVEPGLLQVLYDPQTAGGLLVSLTPADAEAYVAAVRADGYAAAAIVGTCVSADPGGFVTVVA